MKIEGSYRGLKGNRETIYRLIMDPQVLKKCIPGCKELTCIESNRYQISLTWGYRGVVQVEKTLPPSQLKLILEGKGDAGSVKASGIIEFETQEKNNILAKYIGEFHLGGPAAFLQMGASAFGSVPYEKMVTSFFKNFEAELAAVIKE